VRADRDCTATAWFDFHTPRAADAEETKIFAGLASLADAPQALSGIVRAGYPTRDLQFLAGDGRGFQ
jgi:hypothetical protein